MPNYEIRFQVFEKKQTANGASTTTGGAITSMASQVVYAPNMQDARHLVKAQYGNQHVEVSSTRQVD